jgi:pimeloyl-ACP methyl ester carboxylesterase
MSTLKRKRIVVTSSGHSIGVSVLEAKRKNQWIVALHGIQTNSVMFEPLFAQSFTSRYSLLAIDLIGFGESDKPEDFSYTVEDQAKVVMQVLDLLGIEQMHVIGHSLGGMIGTLLLPELGSRAESFANLESNLVASDCGASKEAVKFSIEEFESTEYHRIKASIDSSGEPSAASRSKWLQMIPAMVFYKTSISIVEWSTSEKLREIFNTSTVRRLYMYGSKNAAKAKSVTESVKKVEIPNAGHFMLIDQPHACHDALKDFIVA